MHRPQNTSVILPLGKGNSAFNNSGSVVLIDVERYFTYSRNITDSNITIKNGTSYLQYTNHRSIRLDSNDTVNGTMIQIKFGLDPRGMATF